MFNQNFIIYFALCNIVSAVLHFITPCIAILGERASVLDSLVILLSLLETSITVVSESKNSEST